MHVCDMKAEEKPGEASSMRQRKDEAAVLAGVQGNPTSKQEVLRNGTSCPQRVRFL